MAAQVISKRKKQQRQAAIRLIMMVAIIIMVNILAAYLNINFDLTQEKRFTLSPSTTKMLRNLKDVAVVDVYLDGKDFPAGFRRLEEATKERLKSFKEFAGSHIVYHFINPTEGKSNQEVYDEFLPKGMEPVSLETHGEKMTAQIIVPYALVHYHGNEMPVKLLETHLGMSAMEQLNLSESQLEYKLGNAIHKLSMPDKPRIAYVMGNGEPLGITTFDGLSTLSRLYHVDTIDIQSGAAISNAYNAIIINKPIQTFDDKEKFKIDQYIMYGGHVLWMVDAVDVPMDSLQKQGFVLAMNYDLNLDDMLFKYGVRINPDLVEDMSCAPLAVVVGKGSDNGGQPDMQLRPWIYFPILYPDSKHPIVNNMDGVFSRFASSIDTVKDPSIKKTVLLASSQYSRVTPAPIRVNLSLLQFPPREEMFKSPYHPVAVLLQGKFPSVFQNRLPVSFLQVLRDSLKHPFKANCDSTSSMIVVSDGDIMMNDYNSSGPLEMGYWQYTRDHFANKSFLLNCMDYLTDPNSMLEARSKDLRLRLLDSGRVEKERLTWQFVNIGIPVLAVLIFASAYIFFRKRRYERKSPN
ncbi:MAG: gliding motility-associated ABC transporter substrate-binding protein GldG [Flavipsychrobacter sp.]